MPYLKDLGRRWSARGQQEETQRTARAPEPVSDDLKAEIAALKRRVAELESRTSHLVRFK